MKKIGSGASRIAYLREDGKVVKKPKYKSQYNWLGAPEPSVITSLLKEFSDDPTVMKIQKMREKGMSIPSPCLGTLAEYLFSLKLKKSSSLCDCFALCEEIQIKKRRDKDQIAIIGIYENAFQKIEELDLRPPVRGLYLDLPFKVNDLHQDNTVEEKIIVDYACLEVVE